MMHSLKTLPFTNSFAALPEAFYTRVHPTPFETQAKLIHFNARAAALLPLDADVQNDSQFVEVFSGKRLLPGMDPIAMLYAGHQFGHYVSQLGDGRAILLGETTNSRGDKWEIQLKGSGLTPYSRSADGRAVLRSSIREYLCSEAMHSLGIPTTRALCLIGSSDEVYREHIESGAMLTRIAPSHVRFGSFEVFYYREQYDHIRTLADYIIAQHYPELREKNDRYLLFLQTIIERTAQLLAQWQAVGFAHGVMNTDNMSILGLTLDYGPYGFMEAYNPGFVCNHSDYGGRYAFDRQPEVGHFNLSCLAQTLLPLIELDAVKAALDAYPSHFTRYYQQLMMKKLGFEQVNEQSLAIFDELLEMMKQSRTDYTLLFRTLGHIKCTGNNIVSTLRNSFVDREHFDIWLDKYRVCLSSNAKNDNERQQAMLNTNPKYVLRNYLAQLAIEKAEHGDYSEIENIMNILYSPFEEHPSLEHYAKPPPDGAGNIQVSCSS